MALATLMFLVVTGPRWINFMHLIQCYEIQYTWTARSTETETETGLDRYVMLGARWLTEY